MKCQLIPCWAVLSALSISLFTSCVKQPIPDRLEQELKACPILSLNSGDPTDIPIYTIDYNQAGNPTGMIFAGMIVAGTVNYQFRYDRHNRLTDWVTYYVGNTGGVIWHRYGYPDGQTVTDTSYDYVGDINSPEPPHSSFDTYLVMDKLDGFGRIIRQYTLDPANGSIQGSPQIFFYDARGDKVRPGVTYDNEFDLYQTNSVWMFIFNDYSVNNPLSEQLTSEVGIGGPVAIPSYNSSGLPLEITGNPPLPAGGSNIWLFGFLLGDQLQLEYGCDLKGDQATGSKSN
jgi:hypothetical protein